MIGKLAASFLASFIVALCIPLIFQKDHSMYFPEVSIIFMWMLFASSFIVIYSLVVDKMANFILENKNKIWFRWIFHLSVVLVIYILSVGVKRILGNYEIQFSSFSAKWTLLSNFILFGVMDDIFIKMNWVNRFRTRIIVLGILFPVVLWFCSLIVNL